MEIIRVITQETLLRVGSTNLDRKISGTNVIEFWLHPNGQISDLKLVEKSNHHILNKTSLETIEYSYHKYPSVKEKTLIRYRVSYY